MKKNLEKRNKSYLRLSRIQIESYTSQRFVAIAHVAQEAHEHVEQHHHGHGDVEHAGAAQEVRRLRHAVLNRQHHADALHRKYNCTGIKFKD